jgi:hypothetical protein
MKDDALRKATELQIAHFGQVTFFFHHITIVIINIKVDIIVMSFDLNYVLRCPSSYSRVLIRREKRSTFQDQDYLLNASMCQAFFHKAVKHKSLRAILDLSGQQSKQMRRKSLQKHFHVLSNESKAV